MTFSRKITVYYAGVVIGSWLLGLIVSLCLSVLPFPYEVGVLIIIGFGFFLFLHALLGLVLMAKRLIPAELALTTLYVVPLLIVTWGLKPLHKPIPFVVAIMLNCAVALWHCNPETRERSGIFK